MSNTSSLADYFLLDPEVTFLNHGSFGACPVPVFEAYQHWQRELELQPVNFIQRRLRPLLDDARAALSEYVGAPPDTLAFVMNASVGLNIIARSLDLQPGDEVLTTDQEYGTLIGTWKLVCEMRGATYVPMVIELPVQRSEEIVEAVWAGVTERTRVLFLSHITSPTALILPVEELVRRARERGIITIIDGAHAPGQIPVDVSEIDADFYVGNCHKWLMAPKGAAFLYAREDVQKLLVPLVGGRAEDLRGASRLVAEQEHHGTRDFASFLSVPAAIRFMRDHDWNSVRRVCYENLLYARNRLKEITGLPDVLPESNTFFSQMTILPLPPVDAAEFAGRLYENHAVEIPVTTWKDQRFLRISLQGYNSRSDIDTLAEAVAETLAEIFAGA